MIIEPILPDLSLEHDSIATETQMVLRQCWNAGFLEGMQHAARLGTILPSCGRAINDEAGYLTRQLERHREEQRT